MVMIYAPMTMPPGFFFSCRQRVSGFLMGCDERIESAQRI